MKAENTDIVLQEIINRKIGILGVGQMGSALLLAFSNYLRNSVRGVVNDKELFYLYDPNEKIKSDFKGYGFKHISHDEKEIFDHTKIIFICVKPDLISELLSNNKLYIDKNTLLVSIVAGSNIEYITSLVKSPNNPSPKIIRIMTNHHCLINEGASVFASSESCTNLDENIVTSLLSNVGLIKKVKESQMNVFTAFSGSGPAFVYYFVESLIDGALMNGIDVNTAREYAIQLLYSSGKYLKDSKSFKNPNNYKYIVTTPGGTTIAGLTELDRNKFKYAVISAITKATEQASLIEKEKMKKFSNAKF
jgi:pyrroline-5-carboxylate reductase